MRNLNEDNGADKVLLKYAEKAMIRFAAKGEHLIGAELGIAYGGGVEAIGKMWESLGTVYGFDTFTGHPKEISYSPKAHEAYCMDLQYKWYGTDKLSYEYQRAELDRQGLSNVILRKGLINDDSMQCIEKLHYVLLDLDFLNAMALGITLVRPLLVSGSYLCMHDCIPRTHIFGLWGLYQELMASGEFRLVEEVITSYLVVLEKI